MGLGMSTPRPDREGDVRRQYRTQYAYIFAQDPSKAPRVQKKKKKTLPTKKKLMWLRYDLMVLRRFPQTGASKRFKHLRAQRKSLGPLLGAREKLLMRREIRWTGKPWSEV
jgi:hypothetical protein